MMTRRHDAMTSVLAAILVLALQHPSMPAGMSHEEHLKQLQKDADLKTRGNAAMGFDQDKTTHRFRTSATGGSIEVEVKDAADTTSLAQIREHLKAIAAGFADGDFSRPIATHAEVPPGVATLQRLKGEVTYAYADSPHGGVVRIRTSNAEALSAVHEFLRYQIQEHHTS
jgi:hypothetical protein